MMPTDLLKLVAFFEQCQATNEVAGILEKIAKDKKQPKEKKMAHLLVVRSSESSYPQNYCHQCNYCQSDQCNCDDQ